jgi:hypothetical protein
MLDKGRILVMVVRSILRSQTGPLFSAVLRVIERKLATAIPRFAPDSHEINVTQLNIATELVTMLFMLSTNPNLLRQHFYSYAG